MNLQEIKQAAFEDELQKIALSSKTLGKISTGVIDSALKGGKIRSGLAKSVTNRVEGRFGAPTQYVKRYAQEATKNSVIYL